MFKINQEKNLKILIEGIIIAIVLAVPLYFSLFFETNYYFSLDKIVLFKILVLLLLPIFFVFYSERRQKIFLNKKIIIFFLPFTVFYLSQLIAWFFSRDRGTSWFGMAGRFEGLESLTFYFLFIFLLFIFLIEKKKEDYEIFLHKVLSAMVFSSVLVSVYGIIQWLGLDYYNWNESMLGGRVASTIGQPNFLGSYLLLVVPISVYFLLRVKRFLVKFLILILLFFQIFTVYITSSRGTWMGLIAGIFLGLVIFLYQNGTDVKVIFKNRRFRLATLCFFLFFLGFVFFNPIFQQRVVSSFNTKSGSVALRMFFWRDSWEAFQEKPLFGFGQESQFDIFPRYYEKEWALFGNINDYPDRAHNIIFDHLLTSGLVGFLAFFYLIISILWRGLVKVFKRREKMEVDVFLSISIFSCLASLLFSFFEATTSIYFWLISTLIIAHYYRQLNPDSEENNIVDFANRKNRNIIRLVILFFVMALSFWLAVKTYQSMLADYYFYSIKKVRAENNLAGAIYLREEIVKLNLLYNYSIRQEASLFADWLQRENGEERKKVLVNILKDYLSKIKTDTYKDRLVRARIYSALSENEEYSSKARELYEGLVAESPKIPGLRREFSQFLFKKNDLVKATKELEEAILFVPDITDSRMNDEHRFYANNELGLIYRLLGDISLEKKEYQKAEDYYLKAKFSMPHVLSLDKKISDTYYARGDFDQAIWYNKHGMIRNPKDYTWPYVIAMLYKEKGDKKTALEYAEKALVLSAENKEVISLIKDLK